MHTRKSNEKCMQSHTLRSGKEKVNLSPYVLLLQSNFIVRENSVRKFYNLLKILETHLRDYFVPCFIFKS
jgi:hypothetical protein